MLPLFTAYQCVWAVLCLEFWKRREARTALEWGTLGLDEAVPDRPGFRGAVRPSLVDGRPETFYPKAKRNWRSATSFVIVGSLVVVVVCSASGVIASRLYFRKNLNSDSRIDRDQVAAGFAAVPPPESTRPSVRTREYVCLDS